MNSLTSVDLRIDAGFLVPVQPEGVLKGHAVLVSGETIVAIVPVATADARYVAKETLVLPAHVLMPGLVNAHTHAAMSLLRGIADDVPLLPWLQQHIWPREARFVAPDFVFDGTLLAAAEMLQGGTTTCADMYFHPADAARAFDTAGMRAVLGIPVLDFPTPYAADADAYLQQGLAARDAFASMSRLRFALAPHAPYTVGDDTWRKIVMFARQLDLPIVTHLAETRQEVDDALRATGATPLARLDALGVTGPSFIAVHGVHLTPSDLAVLVAQGSHVVHCPASNMKLASGIAPVQAMLDAGLNVSIGTDGAASNNRLDLFSEMRLASLLAKVATGNAAAVPAATALRMATLNGAQALGLDAMIGSLQPGKLADLIAVDLGGVDSSPVFDPVSHLVHVAGRECVTDVWISGARIVRDRQLQTIDTEALLHRTRAWQRQLAIPLTP
ncbi:MAG: TRZ/ATZ family hydrolase [Casimicrobiaceae bacterium]